MIGLGSLINTAGIIGGGLAGALFGRLLRERHQATLTMACGVSTLFIGMAGALKYMAVPADNLPEGGAMLAILCLTLGGLVGEIIDLEDRLERFGEWLKRKTGNAKDQGFVSAFVTASLTVCIGAMAVVGAIQDGISGDWSILGAKTVLDFIIIMVMTSAMGKGCVFSAIPVLALEGSVTVLATFMRDLMTPRAMDHLSMVGSILIFCVGVNLVWGKKIRVANLLPSIVFAVIAAFLPIAF